MSLQQLHAQRRCRLHTRTIGSLGLHALDRAQQQPALIRGPKSAPLEMHVMYRTSSAESAALLRHSACQQAWTAYKVNLIAGNG